MNKRFFLIIGGLFGVAILIVVAVLLMDGNRPAGPEPSPTPSGSVVLPNGQVVDEDEYEDSLTEEPEGPRGPNGALIQTDPHSDDGQLHTDDDGHDHGNLVARRHLARHAPRHRADSLDAGHRRAAELHDDTGHRARRSPGSANPLGALRPP